MSDGEFLDTNILVYAADIGAGIKREIALDLLERAGTNRTACLSLQVLQEYYVTVTRKLGMPKRDALGHVERLGRWRVHRPSVGDVIAACEAHGRQPLSFWDAMILRSASQMGCQIVWSEDLADGWQWQGVTVRNPFVSQTEPLDSK
jgi:predicted nucleic acid-binding protein